MTTPTILFKHWLWLYQGRVTHHNNTSNNIQSKWVGYDNIDFHLLFLTASGHGLIERTPHVTTSWYSEPPVQTRRWSEFLLPAKWCSLLTGDFLVSSLHLIPRFTDCRNERVWTTVYVNETWTLLGVLCHLVVLLPSIALAVEVSRSSIPSWSH